MALAATVPSRAVSAIESHARTPLPFYMDQDPFEIAVSQQGTQRQLRAAHTAANVDGHTNTIMN